MLTNCVICGNLLDKREPLKIIRLMPSVCSINCFKLFLDLIKVKTFDDIILKAKEAKLIIQKNNEKNAFRSKVERKVSEFLTELGIEHQFEPYIFYGAQFISYKYQPLQHRCYIPDFLLTKYNIFVEVKEKLINNNKPLEFSKTLPIICMDNIFIKRLKQKRT